MLIDDIEHVTRSINKCYFLYSENTVKSSVKT